jgi:hypothetical protein
MPGMGFRLARSLGMEGSTGNLHDLPIAPGNVTPIYKGDMVSLTAGFVTQGIVTPGTKFIGIFWGCRYTAANGDVVFSNYWDGGTGRTNIQAQIAFLPAGMTALVKGIDGAAYTAADIGTRKAHVFNAGDARTGMSRATLAAPGATTASAGFIVLAKIDMGDNANWFEVSLAADSSTIALGS